MPTEVNGITLDTLNETIQALKKDPGLGACQFRATNRWIAGNRNVGTVSEFHAARQDLQHRATYETRSDEPPLLAGDDSAANPVEHLLTALAACLTTAMVAHAAVRGIRIEALESEIEGDIDLNGFLGLRRDVPRGYQELRIRFTVTSDATADELEELARFSPVYNTVVQGAPVKIDVARRPARQAEAPQPTP